MLLLSWTFLRAVISWWLNLIRALLLCLLLIDSLITIVCSLPILSSPFLFSLYSLPNPFSHFVFRLSALSCHSWCSHCRSFTLPTSLPPFYTTFFSSISPLSLVVLLDTTTVLGELDWKTYPVNGVSDISIY